MTIRTRPIGRLGGGVEIHRIDVPDYSTGEASRELVTVPIPDGVRAKLAVTFRVSGSGGTSAGNYPTMIIGSAALQVGSTAPVWGGVVVDATGPITIRHTRATSAGAYAFPVTDFVVYWWENAD